jgi:hypothetical protein
MKWENIPTVAGKTEDEWVEILRPLMKDETEYYVRVWFKHGYEKATDYELERREKNGPF